MSALSNYLEEQLLIHLFRNTNYSRPATIYVALHTGDPGETGASAEVSGGSYARQGIATGASSGWAVPASEGGGGYLTENSADLTFPTATADWGTVSYCSLWDAESSGNCLFIGQLTASKTVNNGDTFKFLAGALDIILR